MADDSNVIVHAVDLNLQVRIALNQGGIRVLAPFELPPQVHDLVLFAPNLDLHVFELRDQVQVGIRLLIRPLVQISVFILVPLFQSLQMVKLVNKATQLTLEITHLTVAFLHRLLFLLQVVLFLVDLPVEVLCAIERLRGLKLQGAHLARQLLPLVRSLFVLHVQALNFLEVGHVPLPEQIQFIFAFVFLSLQALVGHHCLVELVLQPLDFGVSFADRPALPVELH